jgi:hypothetical protein
MRQKIRHAFVPFGVLAIMCVPFVFGGQVNASVPAVAPSGLGSTGPGPGYELEVGNVAYGYNAPQLSSFPDNPTEGPGLCSTATWGTCPAVGIASVGDNANPGYWVGYAARRVASDGQVQYGGDVFGIGNTDTCNEVSDVVSNAPVVGIASAQDGALLAAADGGVFSFCGAPFYGSMGGQHLNQPIVGIAATPDGGGYWLVASDGGVFSFGDAAFHGSMGGQHLNQPIVGIAATPSGHGYWLVASDGGVFSFGDAAFHGSMGGQHLNQPMVAIAANPDGTGYWTASSDGGVFSFGDAPFRGSAVGAGTLEGIAASG